VVLIGISIGMMLVPWSASASETNAVPQSVNNLDLCTLAYQLYHQSLCLPLDPWYDIMSRVGSDRRTNICRFTHEYATQLGKTGSQDGQGFYSGPNAARNWNNTNSNLDPILTNYKSIDAKLPAFTRDGERFLALVAQRFRKILLANGVSWSLVEQFADCKGG